MTSTPNPYAERNRALKVSAIVALIDSGAGPVGYDPHADAEGIARWLRTELDDDGWLRFAQRAGFKSKKTPGPDTRAAVQFVYEQRALAAEHLEAS